MNRIIAFTALVAVPFLAPALAQSLESDHRIQVVRHADLDLTQQAGIRELDRRIFLAVKQVCGPTSDADPAGKNDARRCRITTGDRLSAQRDRIVALALSRARTILASQY